MAAFDGPDGHRQAWETEEALQAMNLQLGEKKDGRVAVLLLGEVTELRELVQEGGHDVAVPPQSSESWVTVTVNAPVQFSDGFDF